MARILLGVSGGIAAYRALELARLATRAGHGMRVLMTPTAERFVGAASFEGIVGAPVLTSEFDRDPLRGAYPGDAPPTHEPIGHLELVANADAFLVAPASANTLAKLAIGICDSMLATSFLACTAPRAVAPAMNDRMYADAATQANLATLRDRGVRVIEPDTGALASRGEYGTGRLPEPPDLLAAFESALRASHELDGLEVLVTAGGTREPIDAVRYVGNRSSGRMGFALAEEAARRGAGVTVVAANVSLPRRDGIDYVDVRTAAELAAACEERFDAADVLLMAAAVADYRPAHEHQGKLKKDQAGEELQLRLVRTTDVLATLAPRRRPGQLLVGFAAEHGEGALANARSKLERKGLDAVVLNDVGTPGIAFDAADNEVTVVTESGNIHVPRASKAEVATAILDAVLSRRSSSDMKVPR